MDNSILTACFDYKLGKLWEAKHKFEMALKNTAEINSCRRISDSDSQSSSLLALNNNIIVCNFLLKYNIKSTEMETLLQTTAEELSCLHRELQEMHSGNDETEVRRNTSAELLLTFNYVVVRWKEINTFDAPTISMMNTALEKLAKQYLQTVLTKASKPTDLSDSIQMICHSVSNLSEQVWGALVLCSFVLIFYFANQLEFGKGLSIINCLLDVDLSTEIRKEEPCRCRVLPLTDHSLVLNSGELNLSLLEDWLRILKVVFLLRLDKGTKALEPLQDVTAAELKHIKLYLQAKLGNSKVKETEILQLAQLCKDTYMESMVYQLLAQYMAKTDNVQTALHFYKQSLQSSNVTNLSALYEVSLQYQKLGNTEAALEALNLLVKKLEGIVPEQAFVPVIKPMQGLCIESQLAICLKDNISLEAAEYVLASLYLQLSFYKMSRCIYKKLVTHLTESIVMQLDWNAIPFPGVLHVYHEAAYACLLSDEPAETVNYCNTVLSLNETHSHRKNVKIKDSLSRHAKCYYNVNCTACTHTLQLKHGGDNSSTSNTNVNLTASIDESPTSEIKRRRIMLEPVSPEHKRDIKVSESCDRYKALVSFLSDRINVDLVALILKCEALQKLSERDKALQCLSSVITKLSTLVVEEEKWKSHIAYLMSDLHLMRGMCLSELNRFSDAVHQFRMSLQYKPDNTSAMYNNVLVLFKCGRHMEAGKSWCLFRNINYHGDGFQLTALIKEKDVDLCRINGGAQPDTVDVKCADTLPLKKSQTTVDLLTMDKLILQLLLESRR